MKEVSDIIRTHIKEPALTEHLVSVFDVEVSRDLRHAKIFVSVLGEADDQKNVMDILTEWTPAVRSEIGKRVRLRYTPEIKFVLDDSLARGTRVTELLNKISRGEV